MICQQNDVAKTLRVPSLKMCGWEINKNMSKPLVFVINIYNIYILYDIIQYINNLIFNNIFFFNN